MEETDGKTLDLKSGHGSEFGKSVTNVEADQNEIEFHDDDSSGDELEQIAKQLESIVRRRRTSAAMRKEYEC